MILSINTIAQSDTTEATVSTILKTGFGNKDGLLDIAQINGPDVIIADSIGNIYIDDYRNYRIKKIASGTIATMIFYDRSNKLNVKQEGLMASSMAYSPNNIMYIGAYGRIYKIGDDNTINTVIETNLNGSSTTMIQPVGSTDYPPRYLTSGPVNSMQFDKQGNLFFICDMQILEFTKDRKLINIAGRGVYDKGLLDGPSTIAKFNEPTGLVLDSKGTIFITDKENNCVRKIEINGTVSTFAGNGISGFKNGKGIDARFKNPVSISIDKNDNLYICDQYNNAIRKITPTGEVSTIAGGVFGYDDGKGEDAKFQGPQSIYYNYTDKKIYICDMGNNAIRILSFNK